MNAPTSTSSLCQSVRGRYLLCAEITRGCFASALARLARPLGFSRRGPSGQAPRAEPFGTKPQDEAWQVPAKQPLVISPRPKQGISLGGMSGITASQAIFWPVLLAV